MPQKLLKQKTTVIRGCCGATYSEGSLAKPSELSTKNIHPGHLAREILRISQDGISVFLSNICSNKYLCETQAPKTAWSIKFIPGSGSANEALSFSTTWW